MTPGLIRRLTVAGWLLLGGEIGFIMFQLERVRGVDGTRFASAWDQRIEVLSFVVLPPNVPALAPAAAVAIGTTLLVAPADRGPWLDALLRLVAGIAITLVAIGLAAIVEVATRPGAVDLDPIFLRLGGMSLAAGIAMMCRIADRA
ncbi:MAG: hypothetical protein HKN44_03455 [Ilumatobacter sp.]|nr:hypothetical protein [Ilumatobacter sp.]